MGILTNTYYGNTIQEWLIAFGIIFGVFILSKIIYWASKNVFKKSTLKTKTKIDDILVDMVEEPFVFSLTLFGIWLALGTLNVGDVFGSLIAKGFQFLIVLTIAWLIVRFIDAFSKEYVEKIVEETETDLDDTLLPIVRRGLKVFIWILAVIVALNNAGYNVGAVLAGLGIGGLAFALAAKDILANIFGGVNILMDKPFKVNEVVTIDGFTGKVEDIGLRSTRIRTREGRVLTIPNSKFTGGIIENISLEPSRKVIVNLGLTYDTTPQKMRRATEILMAIADKNKGLRKGESLVSFTDFSESSMNILFIYYIKKSADILKTKNEINLEILEQFNRSGLEFAYPTRTVFSK